MPLDTPITGAFGAKQGVCAAMGVLLVLAATLQAQDVQPLALAPNGKPDLTARDVYLNDSFEASDAFHQAKALAARGRYGDAAETLQHAADRIGDHLVRVRPGHYVGVRRHVHDTVRAWPAAGIGAYQDLFDVVLRRELDRAQAVRSIEPLVVLFERYFCTKTASDLAGEIAERAIESGDLALARYVLARVLSEHPSAAAHTDRYRALGTILDAMEGRISSSDDVPEPQRGLRIRWMGQDQTLEDVTNSIAAGFSQLRAKPQEREWPIFGGDSTRNRPAKTTVDELGLLWRVDLEEPAQAGMSSPFPTDIDDEEEERVHPRDLTMQPVVAGGIIYVQKLRQIIAMHVNTGEIAWRFRADGADVDDNLYLEDQPPGWDAVTVADGRVYAALPGDAVPYYSYDSSRTPHELVCLDARTGSVKWRVNQRLPDDRFSEIHFDSSPLVRLGDLFVIGRRSRSFGFEDCYLYRFDATTGAFEHRTHLGSASTGGFGARPATRTVAAMYQDSIYVNTNLGSIARVSAHTGAVRWLRLHDRSGDEDERGGSRFGSEHRPWQFNAQIYTGGRLITLANGGTSVFVHDAEDGELLQDIPIRQFGKIETLLGLRGNLLCGVGAEAACYDLDNAEFAWIKPLPTDAGLFGRGVWADDRLIVPTRSGLSFYSVSDGARTDIAWDVDAEGGNVVALPDQLIVAGARTVSVYVRKTEIWQSLRARMAAAPNDPLPALELAELALRSGEKTDAMNALREAVRRASEAETAPDAMVSARLFKDAVSFAESLTHRNALGGEELGDLFTWAARFPLSAAEHLDYRIRFSSLFERHGRPDRALELYHQILRDRSLRGLPIPPESGSSLTAATFAQLRIGALIEKNGRALYESFETAARGLLTSGKLTNDETTLRRVVETYPNSRAAPEALLAMGQLASNGGRPIEAARLWSRAYHRYPQHVDRPQIIRRIADAYEAVGRPDYAYRWLTKGAREFPRATVDDHGAEVSLERYRDRLARVRTSVEPTRPRVPLPMNERFERTFGETLRLLTPLFWQNPRQRWSRCYVHTKDGIVAVNPTNGRDLWSEPLAVRSKPELLLATDKRAFFSTAYQVFCVDASSGRRLWTFGLYPPDFDEANADWEDGRVIRHRALYRDKLLTVRDDGEVACLDLDTGTTLWMQNYQPRPGPTTAVFDEWIAYAELQNGRVIVRLLDPSTGKRLKTIETDIQEAPERVVITIDGQLVLVTPRTIAAYDTENHQRRWLVKLRGQLRRASLLVDLDAVYYSQDGSKIQKISLDDGRVLWETDDLTSHGDSEPATQREGSFLIVTSSRSISAVDLVTGMTLWQGVSTERPNFVAALTTDSYIVAVDRSDDVPDGKTVAYFYDHRNASGVIPEGGAPNLGPMEDVRAVMALDGALIVQSGSSLMGLTAGAKPVP